MKSLKASKSSAATAVASSASDDISIKVYNADYDKPPASLGDEGVQQVLLGPLCNEQEYLCIPKTQHLPITIPLGSGNYKWDYIMEPGRTNYVEVDEAYASTEVRVSVHKCYGNLHI